MEDKLRWFFFKYFVITPAISILILRYFDTKLSFPISNIQSAFKLFPRLHNISTHLQTSFDVSFTNEFILFYTNIVVIGTFLAILSAIYIVFKREIPEKKPTRAERVGILTIRFFCVFLLIIILLFVAYVPTEIYVTPQVSKWKALGYQIYILIVSVILLNFSIHSIVLTFSNRFYVEMKTTS